MIINNQQLSLPIFSKFTPTVSFLGIKPTKTLKDVVSFSTNKGLNCLENFEPGSFGTKCKGSIPLSNFFHQIKSKKELGTFKYDKEERKIFANLIEERANNIRKINSCKTQKKLEDFINKQNEDFFFGDDNLGICGYTKIINKKIEELKNK